MGKQVPQSYQHSRQYRLPDSLLNQTVLIVGAAVSVLPLFTGWMAEMDFQTSGSEISRDIIKHAKKIYQSVRVSLNSVVVNMILSLHCPPHVARDE